MLSYYDFKVVGPTQTDSGKGVQIRVVATVRTDIDVPPQLQGRLKVSKTEYLVQYRSAIKSNAVRNTVEIGTQAKALANVQEFLQKAPGINSADEIEKADAVVKQKAGQQAAKDAGDDTMGAPDAPEPTASADPNATI
jgi:protein involved in temperature-dependent protein secretion